MRNVRGNLTRYFFPLHPVQRAQTASKLAKGHVIIIQPKDIEIIARENIDLNVGGWGNLKQMTSHVTAFKWPYRVG